MFFPNTMILYMESRRIPSIQSLYKKSTVSVSLHKFRYTYTYAYIYIYIFINIYTNIDMHHDDEDQ